MKIGFIGLGKMGGGMVRRLRGAGLEIIAFDRNRGARRKFRKSGVTAVRSLKELAKRLEPPRIVWVMVPAGQTTGRVIEACAALLKRGDLLIDGGNSFYRDSIRRGAWLRQKGIRFLDVGTSGGIRGSTRGYCLTAGGEKRVFEKAEPILQALAPEGGYAHVGPSGAGHFVKMVHNGIEYALLQAYGEGFEILHHQKEFPLDLQRIARLWNRGSVIRSWLLELIATVLQNNPDLKNIPGYIEDSGEGRWTVAEAMELSIPVPLITLSLLERFHSRRKESFSAKLIAALRREFGGHGVKPAG